MKPINYLSWILPLLLAGMMLSSCEEWLQETEEPDEETPVNPDEKATGNLAEEEMENREQMPRDLSLITIQDADDVQLGSAVTLDNYLPPIGDQGPYGTCTAWGCGYYTRAIMYAREHNLTSGDLQDPAYQFSAKYLFLAIPDQYKGDNCKGSWPGAAFEVMQTRGIATESVVPYDDLGNCSENIQADWDADAANYKIESYRTIGDNEFTVETFKSYLAMGRPVQISCALDPHFFGINSDEVYTMADTDYSTDPDEHGRHAMCLIGYDDNKGPNGAFKIVNSWGSNWGDKGTAWIDYNLFIDKFCYAAYVIESDKGGLAEDLIDANVVNPNFRVEGQDLISIRFTDEQDPESSEPNERLLTYNVFNKGSETIRASDDWSIVYYYYNAYNPSEDYGVIVYDYYTDDVGDDYYGMNDDFANIDVAMDTYGMYNWWNYVDVPAGYSVAKAVYDDGYDYDFEFLYTMPDLTGDYYFVLMADGFNDIEEQYEQNNYIFLTGDDKAPLQLENGVIQNMPAKEFQKKPMHYGALKGYQPNTYRLDELEALINYQKRTGQLQEKARAFKQKQASQKNNRAIKRLVPAKLPRTM